MSTLNDYSETGTRLEGAFENDRNTESADLFKAIIREAYGVQDVICGHHLVYQREERHTDGFTYTFVQEIPSADALIFDHDVAKKIFGDKWQDNLVTLALTPVTQRDAVLASLYRVRP
jgi:hypothetical protein